MGARHEVRRDRTPRPTIAPWLVAAAFAATMLGTTLPTPLYVLYQRQLGLSTLALTVVFAAYGAGVLLALLLFGRASDAIGYRRTLLPGLACAAASSVAFLLADSFEVLIAARLLSGLSAGVFTGTATAAIVALAQDRERAVLVATAANMGGLGAGPVVAGLLAQYAHHPLQLTYVVHLVLLTTVTCGIWAIPGPREPVRESGFRWGARLSVPRGARLVFARSAAAVFAGFAMLGLFTAVVPLFLAQLLQLPSPAAAGLVVGALFGASTFGQVIAPLLGSRATQAAGAMLTLGALTLALAVASTDLTPLLLAVPLAGTGQGITFRASISLLQDAAPAHQRSEITSCLFVVAYVAISAPILGEGLAAQVVGLQPAGIGFSLAVAGVAASATRSLARIPPTRAAPDCSP